MSSGVRNAATCLVSDGAVVSALQDPRPASQALGAGGTSAAGQEAAIQLLSTVQALMAVLPLGSLLADPAAAGDNDSLAAGDVQPKGHPGEPLSSRCIVNCRYFFVTPGGPVSKKRQSILKEMRLGQRKLESHHKTLLPLLLFCPVVAHLCPVALRCMHDRFRC